MKASITLEKVQAILSHMTPMTNFVIACAEAGVPSRTADEWLRKGKEMPAPDAQQDDRALYVMLARGVEAKVAQQEKAWIEAALGCDKATDDWKRYAWFLERRFKRYRPEKNVNKVVTGKLELGSLSAEELMKLTGDGE